MVTTTTDNMNCECDHDSVGRVAAAEPEPVLEPVTGLPVPAAPRTLRHRRRMGDDDDSPVRQRLFVPEGDPGFADYREQNPKSAEERRAHIITELYRMLDGPMQAAAYVYALEGVHPTPDEYADGQWPVGRLIAIADAMRPEPVTDPADQRLRIHNAANMAMATCHALLYAGAAPTNSVEELATGFVTVDRLPNGLTMADMWDGARQTDALRFAPPLSGELCEQASPSQSFGRGGSLEDRLDSLLTLPVGVPVWAWIVAISMMVVYAWLVALLVGKPVTSR